MTKEKALQAINDLPTEFDVEQLIEKVIFMDKVEKGLKQLDNGQTISHEEVISRIKKWQK